MGKAQRRQKDPLAEYASLFASRGGKARAKKLTAAERRMIAKKAAQARWGRTKGRP
jgi:hypothetical protein